MKRTLGIFAFALTLFVTAFFAQSAFTRKAPAQAPTAIEAPAVPEVPPPLVQLAILLDTSNSMDGLIDQARTRLWRVVNELAELKRDGRTPELQVAVYEYGNDSLPEAGGYLRQVQAFTSDLDDVSQGLFALTTNGGSEHCGQVIEASLKGLSWDRDPDTLKMIFIAGNEEFTQGPVDYHQAIEAAREMNVTVNTVHCGPEASGIAGFWREGARLAAGRFHSIDQNEALTWIDAPQDQEIATLGAQINRTSLAYGSLGRIGVANQIAQDQNAIGTGRGAYVQRTMTKGTKVYDTSKWDLVSAIKKKKAKIANIDRKLLDQKYAKLDDAALKAEVDKLQQRREVLQDRLAKLKVERERWVDAERKKRALKKGTSFDDSLVESIKSQARSKNFVVDTTGPTASSDAAVGTVSNVDAVGTVSNVAAGGGISALGNGFTVSNVAAGGEL